MRCRRSILVGLLVAVALALAAPALADPPPAATTTTTDTTPVTTTDTGGIQVQTAQPVVEQVAGAHVVRRAKTKHAAPARHRGGHLVVPAATVATLPFTGARPDRLAALGLVLVAAGALLRVAARRGAVPRVSRP